MTNREKVKLLHGPYQVPALRVGDRATCLYRECAVVVTSWTDAPISWPRCRRTEGKGHPSLLVDDELARAIRTESAEAIKHHWRVGEQLVWKWRKAFGIGRTGTEGSARLHRAVAGTRVEALQSKEWAEEERQLKRRIAVGRRLGKTPSAVRSQRVRRKIPAKK